MTSKPEERSGQDAPRTSPPAASRRRWLAAGGAATATAVAALAAASSWRTAPAPAAAVRRTADGLPDVPLLTHEGRRVRFHTDLVRDRVVIITMMYAQCSDRCPPMTQNLKQVHALLGPRVGRDIFMYSITLLPEFDRPPDLQAYMKLQGVGANWTFLTGEKAHVEQLRLALGFYDPDPALDADITRHITMVRIGNDALDRWTMAPAMQEPQIMLESLMAVDPVTRALGRPPATLVS